MKNKKSTPSPFTVWQSADGTRKLQAVVLLQEYRFCNRRMTDKGWSAWFVEDSRFPMAAYSVDRILARKGLVNNPISS